MLNVQLVTQTNTHPGTRTRPSILTGTLTYTITSGQ